jgi:hypothetical protein
MKTKKEEPWELARDGVRQADLQVRLGEQPQHGVHESEVPLTERTVLAIGLTNLPQLANFVGRGELCVSWRTLSGGRTTPKSKVSSRVLIPAQGYKGPHRLPGPRP